jgi:hypothetical protein
MAAADRRGKTGNLLGVAVASLTRAGISNVGFIVPA